MNLRNVLKTYSLLRTLSDDETALLNTLRSLTETEVAMTVEALTGKVGGAGKKAGKKSGKSSSSKSPRASSLRQQIQSRTSEGNGKPALCTYEIDGNVCHGTENDGIHDSTMGYRNYHEFQPAEQAASVSGG